MKTLTRLDQQKGDRREREHNVNKGEILRLKGEI